MKVAIIGRQGFIGSALAKRFDKVGSFPTDDTKILFHFGSPVHPPFEENPDYHINEILSSFMYLLPYCRDRGIYFIYPSSALVYEKDTLFTKTKKMMELMASMYPKTLGLRIFPVYGEGESRTVISQWARSMKKGERPMVYGDGTQQRDFIYIETAVDQILDLVNLGITGVKDIGVGKPHSFNNIIRLINDNLGSELEPLYIKAPKEYSKGIVCTDPGRCTVHLSDGIKKVLDNI